VHKGEATVTGGNDIGTGGDDVTTVVTGVDTGVTVVNGVGVVSVDVSGNEGVGVEGIEIGIGIEIDVGIDAV
jgi:hypothetical protein